MDEQKIKKIVSEFIDSGLIKQNDILVIALSGGPDSMCLFDIFYKLSLNYGFTINAIHINHGIRGEEATRDASFVFKYCKNYNVPCYIKNVDAPMYAKEHNLTLEEAARKLRYAEIEKLWTELTKKNVKVSVYVLVAHHLNDQAETVIHNLIRGTGIKGLSGIHKQSNYILRPLLDISKKEIDEYINRYNIEYVVDSTNDDTAYTRNYIRHEIIDKLTHINIKAISHIAEFAKEAYEIDDYLETLSKFILEKMTIKSDDKNVVKIDLILFRKSPDILKAYMIRGIMKKFVSTLKDVTKVNIDDVINLSMKVDGGHIDLPYNITVDKRKKELIFIYNKENISMKKKRNKS